MSKRIRVAVIIVVGMLMVFLSGLAWSALAGPDAGAEELAAPVGAVQDGLSSSPRAVEASLMRMPLYFIENEGQLDEPVAYYVQGQDKTLYFTPQGLTFVLHGSDPPVTSSGSATSVASSGSATSVIARSVATPVLSAVEGRQSPAIESWGLPRLRFATKEDAPSGRWIVKLEFVGANPDVQPVGVDETGALISYFKGAPEEWKTGLKTYAKVVYRDLWPGIDLQYSGTVNELKYQFVVQPGADPAQIQLAYRGADIAINDQGRMEVSTPAGGFQDGAPYAYQQVQGAERVQVDVSYEFQPGSREAVYGFQVGAYDPGLPLVLDPVVLVYCGFIGGSVQDLAHGIAVDGDGYAYVAGGTGSISTTFPVAVGPDLTYNGVWDAYVAKVSADGTHLDYCGYIGGSDSDTIWDIAVDALGQAYVVGTTRSSESEGFPVIGGPDVTYNGSGDAFVAKVSADGTALVYCGYIGGGGEDDGDGIAVDSEGNAYVVGDTGTNPTLPFFPVIVGPDLIHNGGMDAFVAKVVPDGTALEYCGYIGGISDDSGQGIAVDSSGQAYVAGSTYSVEATFPATVGPDTSHNGELDAFVAKVSADGAALVYCGYIGGEGWDYCDGIAVDSSGNAYVTGSAEYSDETTFPVTVGPDLTYNDTAGRPDVFVAKVTADGRELSYCGYIGGATGDMGGGIAVDHSGCAYVVGGTASSESQGFPVTVGPDLTHNGGYDTFVAKVLADGTGLAYCGYIGGFDDEHGTGIAVDGWGAAYISGWEWSTEDEGFPVITGPDLTYNGWGDAFVTKVEWNYAPLPGIVVPSSGSGPTHRITSFRTSWTDANGWPDLKQCYFHIGDSPALAGNVTLLYQARKNKLWMLADDGHSWRGGHAPGTAHSIENSQAKLHCSQTAVLRVGDTLGVRWAIEFKPGFEGSKKLGLKCKDIHGATTKGKWEGTWTIE